MNMIEFGSPTTPQDAHSLSPSFACGGVSLIGHALRAHEGEYRPSAARLLDAMQASLPQWAVGDRPPSNMSPSGC